MSDQQGQETVQISATQLAELQAATARLQSLEAQRAAEIQAAETRAMLAKGEVNAVVAATAQRVQQAEDRAREFARKTELARALAGQPLAGPHMAAQLEVILGNQ